MEVILLEKVENLGNLGDVVRVRPGFGRNFLLPQGKARRATPDNIKYFEERRKELEQAASDALQAAQSRAEQLEGLTVSVKAKAGDEGKLFGSVGTSDIADAVTAAGVEISRREVQLPEGPIRVTGEYEIELNLHADVSVTITVTVEAED